MTTRQVRALLDERFGTLDQLEAEGSPSMAAAAVARARAAMEESVREAEAAHAAAVAARRTARHAARRRRPEVVERRNARRRAAHAAKREELDGVVVAPRLGGTPEEVRDRKNERRREGRALTRAAAAEHAAAERAADEVRHADLLDAFAAEHARLLTAGVPRARLHVALGWVDVAPGLTAGARTQLRTSERYARARALLADVHAAARDAGKDDVVASAYLVGRQVPRVATRARATA